MPKLICSMHSILMLSKKEAVAENRSNKFRSLLKSNEKKKRKSVSKSILALDVCVMSIQYVILHKSLWQYTLCWKQKKKRTHEIVIWKSLIYVRFIWQLCSKSDTMKKKSTTKKRKKSKFFTLWFRSNRSLCIRTVLSFKKWLQEANSMRMKETSGTQHNRDMTES